MFTGTFENLFEHKNIHTSSKQTFQKYLKVQLNSKYQDILSFNLISSSKKRLSVQEKQHPKNITIRNSNIFNSDNKPIKKEQDQQIKQKLLQLKPLKIQSQGLRKGYSSYLLKQKQILNKQMKLQGGSLNKADKQQSTKSSTQQLFMNVSQTVSQIFNSKKENEVLENKKQNDIKIENLRRNIGENIISIISCSPSKDKPKLKKTRLPVIDYKSLPMTNHTQKSCQKTISPKKNTLFSPGLKGYLAYDQQTLKYFKMNQGNVNFMNQKIQKNRKLIAKNVTAQRYCVIDTQNCQFILSNTNIQQQSQPIEIASLTKIVTAFLTILICKKYQIDIKTFKHRVSQDAAFMPGTSANLQVGDMLTIQNLLYGLMLPSGNDAAVSLSQIMGKIILKNKKKVCKMSPTKIFIKHMNILYQQMIPTKFKKKKGQEEDLHLFQNPSGLITNPNTTTPQQIILVSAVAYKNQLFREIVCRKEYQAVIQNQRYGLQRVINWKNTNKLLWKGWEGIKTGNTENAGPCFIGKLSHYIVGVFDCGSHNKRFNEAVSILQSLKIESELVDSNEIIEQ